MAPTPLQRLAATQAGLLSRHQLRKLGVDRWQIRNHVNAGRWVTRSSLVISTTTGPLSRQQLMWLGVLHAGPEALIAGLSAAEVHGLRNWHRDEITVLVPLGTKAEGPVPGVSFLRSRRSLLPFRSRRMELPTVALEPAVLLYAAHQRSERTAQGVVAAVVQQRLTSPEALSSWLEALHPLRRAPLFRRAIADISGGAQSLAEIDIRRMCRIGGLRMPQRQSKRRDASGRVRFTDCEWLLPDGSVVVLEVDGGFHMDVEHWEDDLARQRRLSGPGRTIVRCTARELRDEPAVVARDLRALGVPLAA